MKLSCAVSSIPADKEREALWLLLNGERREVADGVSLAQLIETLNLAPERIAIELNQTVVRRAEWAATELMESDRIEIVHFVGGGDHHCQFPIAGFRLHPRLKTNWQFPIGNRYRSLPPVLYRRRLTLFRKAV